MGKNGKELYRLSSSQKELTLGEFPPEKCDLWNMVGFHSYIAENCRLDLLEKCWNRVVETHDALRLRMVGRIVRRQYIEDYAYETLPIVKVDGREGFNALEKKERAAAVPMFGGALYRITLVDCGNGAGGMIACLHNLCCDGYTLEMIFEQLESLYDLALRGEEFPVCKEYSYLDYLKQDRKYFKSGECKKDYKWWKEKYRALHHYSIPAGRTTKNVRTDLVVSETSEELYKKMDAFSEEVSSPVTSVIMSAMALSTYRLTGKTCFCFFNLSHGRRTFALRHTAGCMFLVNPVFFQIDAEKSFREMVKQDYMNYLEFLQHGRLPWEKHLDLSYFESVKLGFNFHHHWIYFSPMGLGGLSAESKLGLEAFDEDVLENPFYCAVYDMPEENLLHIDLNYQMAKFSAEQMEHARQTFEDVLAWSLEHPDRKIQDMDIG